MRPDDGPAGSLPQRGSVPPGAGSLQQVHSILAQATGTAPVPHGAEAMPLRLDRSVALIGPMGSGKSTVGRELARRLGVGSVDTDQVFCEIHGPIPEFFAAHGEPAFRAAEAEVVQAVLATAVPLVVSLGGGSVISATTRTALRSGSHPVLLEVDEAEALARLGRGQGRPVLAGDPAGTWRRILSEREHLYREVASWTVKTTGLDAGQVAARIAELLVDRQTETLPVPPDQHNAPDHHTGDAR